MIDLDDQSEPDDDLDFIPPSPSPEDSSHSIYSKEKRWATFVLCMCVFMRHFLVSIIVFCIAMNFMFSYVYVLYGGISVMFLSKLQYISCLGKHDEIFMITTD